MHFSASVALTLTLKPFAIDGSGLHQACAVGLKPVVVGSRFPVNDRYLGNGMNDVPKSWRSLLDDLKRETDPGRRLVVCEKARRAMQERLIELSARDESPINFAEGLKGHLLVVHGSGDDNVHYQGTERLVNRLVELGKPFDLMVYPNRTHAIAEGPGTTTHIYQLIARYFTEHLPPGPK